VININNLCFGAGCNYKVSGKKIPLSIEFLLWFLLRIQLKAKGVFFYEHPVEWNGPYLETRKLFLYGKAHFE